MYIIVSTVTKSTVTKSTEMKRKDADPYNVSLPRISFNNPESKIVFKLTLIITLT